jgi:hypothetical protein
MISMDEVINDKESLKKIVTLKQVIESIDGKDPINLENKYFEAYGCHDEKDKITLEAKYVQNQLRKRQEEFKNDEEYLIDINILKIILTILGRSINFATFKALKQNIINIEIRYGIRIRFYSEVMSIYEEEFSRLKRSR